QHSSAGGSNVACLWLDEDRILTQRRNGELIVVGVDGSVRPCVTIPLDEAERAPLMPPRLSRDLDGNVVYHCGTAFRSEPFDREYGASLWAPLGAGFSWQMRDHRQLRRIVRHQGRPIGEYDCAGWSAACPGHLALGVRHHDGGRIGCDLYVWSEGHDW